MSVKLTLLLLLALCAGAFGNPGSGRSLLSVSTPLIGYQQGFDLTIAPPGGPLGNGDPNAECYTAGIPTPSAISDLAQGPVLLDTTQGSGVHAIRYVAADGYSVQNALVSSPASQSLVYDTNSGSIVFDANKATVGESGSTVSVLLKDGQQLCISTVSFNTIAPLSCVPQGTSGPAVPSYPSGNTVVQNPGVSTYIVQQIVQTVINIYNINIVNIVNNYNTYASYSCNTYITNNTYVYPPALPPTHGPLPSLPPAHAPTVSTKPPTTAPPPFSATPPSGGRLVTERVPPLTLTPPAPSPPLSQISATPPADFKALKTPPLSVATPPPPQLLNQSGVGGSFTTPGTGRKLLK